MIRFNCASCGKSIKASIEQAGIKAKCPKCRTSCQVPDIVPAEVVEANPPRKRPPRNPNPAPYVPYKKEFLSVGGLTRQQTLLVILGICSLPLIFMAVNFLINLDTQGDDEITAKVYAVVVQANPPGTEVKILAVHTDESYPEAPQNEFYVQVDVRRPGEQYWDPQSWFIKREHDTLSTPYRHR